FGPPAALRWAPARTRRMEEGAVRARSVALAVVPLLAAVLTACGGTAKQGTGEPTTVRFASYDFVENQILVELYAEAGRRAGLPGPPRTRPASRSAPPSGPSTAWAASPT